ncbi:MAG: hypothetical protein EOO04_05635 [Chitinophagaceae bacterium]|nr:MAG: hypothetical protein EOO04_05635 [Chitinophagaceae bacterium]
MLKQLEGMLMNAREKSVKLLGGKNRNVFVPWIRDHVHVMKAMKYMHPDMISFLEFYLQNQTKEGIYFDYYYPINAGGINDRMKLFDQRYWKVIPEDSIQMHRLPVEADLEYLLVEGVYAVWQATADTAFVKKWLPSLVKGMNYSMTDPLRWSIKHQLVKRGYTLDTWDFMQLPTSREEYKRNGGNIQKGIFNIDENTPMGIMHGDNSGIYAACNQLAIMFGITGDNAAEEKWKEAGKGIRERTNKICWNGKFYAHFIEDDPQPPYLKMDQKNTLSLSNPYNINRGLPDTKMAQSILKTYKDLKQSNIKNSFAEWYGIYPAVQPHFADYKPGSYMNGGVTTIVAGELAKAAFQHGYEDYGVDILNRLKELINKHNGDLPVSYTPEGKVDEGIPDNWGQAAVYSALIEGLAGIVDKSTQFQTVEISPRWLAAGKQQAEVSAAYGPTGARAGYKYHHDTVKKKIILDIEGDIRQAIIRILLPSKCKNPKAWLNGKTTQSKIEQINESRYLVIANLVSPGNRVEVTYE